MLCCSSPPGGGGTSVWGPDSGSASAIAGLNSAPAATTAMAAIASHPRLVELMTADITTLAEWEARRRGAADGERRGRARNDLRLFAITRSSTRHGQPLPAQGAGHAGWRLARPPNGRPLPARPRRT